MSRPKKSKAFLIVAIIAVIVIALTILCFLFNPLVVQPQRAAVAKANAEMKAEVDQRNQDAMTKYQVDRSEWESETKTPTQPNWPEHKTKGWDLVDLSDIPLENQRAVTATRSDLMFNGMLLVNPWHKRPDDYNESDPGIVSVQKTFSGEQKIQAKDNNVRLHVNALNALSAALTDAKEAGYTHYLVEEGFRTIAKQTEYFDKKKEKLASKYSSDEALTEAAKKEVNAPGCSEYNSGLSFELRLFDRNDPEVGNQKYSTTPEARWMNENCWKYGFVFRFPENGWPLETSTDKSFKTGVSVKLNVYRYVGKGNAAIMHYLDYTLEEYIEYLAEHPHIALFVDDMLKYEVYRQPVGESNEINVQLTGHTDYESSLDNMGCIITVFNHNEITEESTEAAPEAESDEDEPGEAEPDEAVTEEAPEETDDQETNAEA